MSRQPAVLDTADALGYAALHAANIDGIPAHEVYIGSRGIPYTDRLREKWNDVGRAVQREMEMRFHVRPVSTSDALEPLHWEPAGSDGDLFCDILMGVDTKSALAVHAFRKNTGYELSVVAWKFQSYRLTGDLRERMIRALRGEGLPDLDP